MRKSHGTKNNCSPRHTGTDISFAVLRKADLERRIRQRRVAEQRRCECRRKQKRRSENRLATVEELREHLRSRGVDDMQVSTHPDSKIVSEDFHVRSDERRSQDRRNIQRRQRERRATQNGAATPDTGSPDSTSQTPSATSHAALRRSRIEARMRQLKHRVLR